MKANISKTVRPLTPDEVVDAKIDRIPKEVIESFNELIAESWNGYSAVFLQNEAIDRILDKLEWTETNPRQMVIDRHYLDVEDIYRKAGWLVEYEKPAYNEAGSAKFTFTKNNRGF